MSPRVAWSLRALAIGIALLAAIDPAITTERRARPTVSVVAVDGVTDQPRADSVARVLSAAMRVVPAPFALADATVLVGDRLPSTPILSMLSAPGDTTPVFAVTDPPDRADVRITRMEAPERVPLHASTELPVVVAVSGGEAERSRMLTLTLRHGDALLDRRTVRVASGDTTVLETLAFVPARVGAVSLRIEATLSARGGVQTRDASDAVATARADAIVSVEERAWNVLVYDPRPSWMSTFVRRALERDPRFAVTSRIVTSRAISTSAGRAPATLDDPSTLAPFDIVILGAPDALGAGDIRGVESYMRQRGGSAVLLFDTRARGATDVLTGASAWSMRSVPSPLPLRAAPFPVVRGADSAATPAPLVATQLLAPVELPLGAESRLANAAGQSIVWQTSVGAGHLIVSGALDAWRYRDPGTSAFDRTWQQLIGDAAAAALPPLVVSVSPRVLAHGDSAVVHVVLRDAALRAATAAAIANIDAVVSAHLEWMDGDSTRREPVRLWPDGAVGSLRGTLRLPAPERSGEATIPFGARLVVAADGRRTETAMQIDDGRRLARADERDLLRRWVDARGGTLASMQTLSSLADSIGRVVQATPRAERWHPMRSLWWLLPLTLALGGEWWLRRRRGLA